MDDFINKVLAKRINTISNNNLNVSIFHNQELILSSSDENVLFENLIASKNLWSFPNYSLGINTSSSSINDIVKERSLINIGILILLNVLIIIGLGFVFYNIRKEYKLSQLKSDFVSNVSHELRTPLSLIGMFAETLELHRVNSEDEKDDYYRIIRKETERLTRIVNSILNFSKMESQSKKYNFENVNLNNIVDDVLKTYQQEFNNGKNTCEVNKFDSLPNLYLDKESVMEAIINLIDNALKYCETNCRIEISTGVIEKSVYLEVTDNGIGISKEDQKRIFDKFYRVTSGNIHNTKGSGLGLTLVKSIMDAHNGQVKVESKLGGGSKFILLFPISK
jgi:two-component system phosphate regulon sensor histidine kinase PhoR